ncbi:MAG: L-seryl-tRNA(Sec) selenium transferase [Alphaproteobacteria bacterium]|jgi:L-seryl-tRNA(Ser) seleniumtransferase|nr:L-seryl-tRNA(Sec) selenium transferase [Alphaproteobacteria bacterium]HJP22753.1 L-seryl-tRNA(Sec) selenium transferase [Alphaproteobacteria bacterium]
MTPSESSPQAAIPSVDRVLGLAGLRDAVAAHGRPLVTDAIREALAALRGRLAEGKAGDGPTEAAIIADVLARLENLLRPPLTRVLNLSGTIIHTNLGRALLPEAAAEAMVAAATSAVDLEYDLGSGRRGDRDSRLEGWLCRLTGADAATVVNNNAAAVLLVLDSLARRKEVPVSRGELIEIGGSFRLPDIMARSNCKLVEVGTTNRTHIGDFEAALGPRTGLVMKVHTSNYVIDGFTAAVAEDQLAELCRAHGIPFVVDLGSGTLVDLARYGLPHEPTPAEALKAGADLVTFSGDKLLGGPQAGIVVGRKDLVAKLKKNPLKRALRIDKVSTAALGAVLPLYADPDRLPERLPALGFMTRSQSDIEAQARRLAPRFAAALQDIEVSVASCQSQIGSGALPDKALPSAALVLKPAGTSGRALKGLAARFRGLALPVIGRIQDEALWFDLRCLDDEPGLLAGLESLGTK